jgi:hypothetical protein
MTYSSGIVSLSLVISSAFEAAQDEGLDRREQNRRAVAALLCADPELRMRAAVRLVRTARMVAEMMAAEPIPIGLVGEYRLDA